MNKNQQSFRIGDPNVEGNVSVNSEEFSKKYREWLKRRGFHDELRQMEMMSGFGRSKRKKKILQEDSNRD